MMSPAIEGYFKTKEKSNYTHGTEMIKSVEMVAFALEGDYVDEKRKVYKKNVFVFSN